MYVYACVYVVKSWTKKNPHPKILACFEPTLWQFSVKISHYPLLNKWIIEGVDVTNFTK